MPVTPTFPGVYIEEVPSGVRTITGVATSIAAFVGFTARGPVDRAVRISTSETSSVPSAACTATATSATRCGSSSRTAAPTPTSSASPRGRPPPRTMGSPTGGGNDALVVSAADPGAGGTSSGSTSTTRPRTPTRTFNLRVVRHELQGGALVAAEMEQYRNLGMNSRSASYAPAVAGPRASSALTRPAGLAFATAASR